LWKPDLILKIYGKEGRTLSEELVMTKDRSEGKLAMGILGEVCGAIIFGFEMASSQTPIIGCTCVVLGLAVSVYGATPVPCEGEVREEPSAVNQCCVHCGTTIMPPSSRFCWNCGASVVVPRRDTAALVKEENEIPTEVGHVVMDRPIGPCLVCDLELKASDILAWCPHCGNAFHKAHLLEWIKIRKCCPVCQEHLDKKELVEKVYTVRALTL
jgi:hypothetical protein